MGSANTESAIPLNCKDKIKGAARRSALSVLIDGLVYPAQPELIADNKKGRADPTSSFIVSTIDANISVAKDRKQMAYMASS